MFLDRYHVRLHQLPRLTESGDNKFKSLIFNEIKFDVIMAIANSNDRAGILVRLAEELIVQFMDRSTYESVMIFILGEKTPDDVTRKIISYL